MTRWHEVLEWKDGVAMLRAIFFLQSQTFAATQKACWTRLWKYLFGPDVKILETL